MAKINIGAPSVSRGVGLKSSYAAGEALPDPAMLPVGAEVVLTGTFAADVTSVLLTVDYVNGVKSWTGDVVSASAPSDSDGLPNGVRWWQS